MKKLMNYHQLQRRRPPNQINWTSLTFTTKIISIYYTIIIHTHIHLTQYYYIQKLWDKLLLFVCHKFIIIICSLKIIIDDIPASRGQGQ